MNNEDRIKILETIIYLNEKSNVNTLTTKSLIDKVKILIRKEKLKDIINEIQSKQ